MGHPRIEACRAVSNAASTNARLSARRTHQHAERRRKQHVIKGDDVVHAFAVDERQGDEEHDVRHHVAAGAQRDAHLVSSHRTHALSDVALGRAESFHPHS